MSNAKAYEGTALREAVRKAAHAAYGDSNDDEIEALREALDEALDLLGVSFEDLTDDIPAAWETW